MAFCPNPQDTLEQRRFAFPGPWLRTQTQVISRIVTRNINIPYFSAAHLHMPAVIAISSRGRCIRDGLDANKYADTIATLEMIAPNLLPDAAFVNEAAARKDFILICLQFLCNHGYENIYSTGPPLEKIVLQAGAVATIVSRFPVANPGEDPEALLRVLANIKPNADILAGTYTQDLAQAVAVFTDWLVGNSTLRERSLRINLYTLCYVSLAKSGQIIPSMVNTINQAVSAETNLACNLTTEDVVTCADALVGLVNETNARAIMARLANQMDCYSSWLRIIVSHTIRSGMRVFWAVRQAFTDFADFPWVQASAYIPADFTCYEVAVNQVNENEYYGFNSNLGDVSHRKYKSLAWLAMQLLIKNKGTKYGYLINCRGVGVPDRMAELQILIDNYVPAVRDLPDT